MAIGASADYRSSWLCVHAMRALLEAGSNVKATDSNHDTALHFTLRHHNHPEAARLLLEHGSDPNLTGSRGQSALHCCIELKHFRQIYVLSAPESTVKHLLEHGADPDQRDSDGHTAVYLSMRAGSRLTPEVFRMLLSRSKDILVKTACFFELLLMGKSETFDDYLEILLAQGLVIDRKRMPRSDAH